MQLWAWILRCRWNGVSTDSNGQQWILNKGDKSEANNGISFKEGSNHSTINNLDAIKTACYVEADEGGGLFFCLSEAPLKSPDGATAGSSTRPAAFGPLQVFAWRQEKVVLFLSVEQNSDCSAGGGVFSYIR